MSDNLLYMVATCFLKGMGPINIKKLIAYTGSVEAIFLEKENVLAKIPGFGKVSIRKMNREDALVKAEKEIVFMHNNNISILFYTNDNFPKRLLECYDSPCLLFVKGNCDFNGRKILSMVGTRSASNYGYTMCDKIINTLKNNNHDVLIISGLAYGIDIKVHKSCLGNKLKTVAVLAHGFDKLYPNAHKPYAQEIINSSGALVSEYHSKHKVNASSFVQRNRIVAGMSDATIIVQSSARGGSLITAEIANSYNRDVFAIPGRIGDKLSVGCNTLIKSNKASLLSCVADLEYILNWENNDNVEKENTQAVINFNLSDSERIIIDLLHINDKLVIDTIFIETEIPMSKLSSLLLNMEFKGLIYVLPGKIYSLKR